MAFLECHQARAQQRQAVGHSQPEGFGLRIKMRVERARREARTLRQRIDAGSAKSASAEAAPGRADQSLPRVAFTFLQSRHRHVSSLFDSDRYIGIDKITIVMIRSITVVI